MTMNTTDSNNRHGEQAGRPHHGESASMLDQELARVRAQAQKYQDQNRRLRLLLESFITGKDECQDTETASRECQVTESGTMTEESDDYQHLSVKYNKLDKSYRNVVKERDEVKQQRDRYKRQKEDYKQHFHKAKQNIREWQAYYDSHRLKVSTKRSPIRTNPPEQSEPWNQTADATFDDFDLTPRPAQGRNLQPSTSPQLPPPRESRDASMSLQKLPGASLPEVSSGPPVTTNNFSERHGRFSKSSAAARARHSLPAVSSQTNSDEASAAESMAVIQVQLEALKQESDPVEFVSERPVRRLTKPLCRTKDSRCRSVGDGSVIKPYNVKDEPISQDDLSTLLLRNNNESLDLDEIPGYVETPSKRKRKRQKLLQGKRSLEGSSQEMGRATSMPADLQSGSSQPEARVHDDRATRSFNSLGTAMDRNDPYEPPLANPSLLNDSTVLRSLSVNEHTRARTDGSKQYRKQRSDGHLFAGIESFAEDGENIASKNLTDKPSGIVAASTSETKRRKIDALLEEHPVRHASVDASNQLTDGNEMGMVHMQAFRQSKTERSPLSAPGSDSRLRQRAKSRLLRQLSPSALTLEDFRPNPRAVSTDEQGYAYTETIRGRDARRCLPGCTDPRCCGSAFSKMVSIGGLAPQLPRSMWDPLQGDRPEHEQDQHVEERRLLGWHIGRDREAQARIEKLTPAERKKAIVDARAALLAERHGKHRQAFTRRTSPHGFWRTDMPTTQESKEDRQKQQEAVREKVRERWEEAIRGGRGARWVFRDEL